jgi:hypothetical protein
MDDERSNVKTNGYEYEGRWGWMELRRKIRWKSWKLEIEWNDEKNRDWKREMEMGRNGDTRDWR